MPKLTNKIPKEIQMSGIGELTGKNLQELREMTAGQIHAAQVQTLNGKSKKEKIEFELDQMEFPDPTTGEDSTNGQVWKLTIIRDADGNVIRKKRFEWSYYPTGEVDIITTTELDASDNVVLVKQIKHYMDGRQPHWF